MKARRRYLLPLALLCVSARAQEECPAPAFRHSSQELRFLLRPGANPLLKAAAKFDIGGVDYLQVPATPSGVELEIHGGEVGLPVNVLRVTLGVESELVTPETCRLVTLYPGQRVQWLKWPDAVWSFLHDVDPHVAFPLRARLRIEIYR